jgi:tripartite-type tricarboxylate transporter receptor subunit TctC
MICTRPISFAAALALAAVMSAGYSPAASAAWPEKPIMIVVPFAAGGSSDNVARTTAEWLGKVLRQTVNVENRAGASGAIAAEYVAQAPADGHTLFMVSVAQMLVLPQMQKVRYDPFKSFTPVSVISTSAFALAANPALPVKNITQLVALAKSKPDELTYGSSGTGSAGHLTMALLLQRAGMRMIHVPYKGVAPAVTDMLGGHVPLVFGSVSEVLRYYKSGRLKVLGVSSEKRLASMPDVQTVAEQGFPGYTVTTWNGLVAPAATPKETVAALLAAIRPACKDAAFVSRFQQIDAEAWCSTPGEFTDMLRADWPKWGDAVKFSGAALN